MIVKLWYNQIISGKKKYSDVPSKLKDAVAAMLTDNGHADLVVGE